MSKRAAYAHRMGGALEVASDLFVTKIPREVSQGPCSLVVQHGLYSSNLGTRRVPGPWPVQTLPPSPEAGKGQRQVRKPRAMFSCAMLPGSTGLGADTIHFCQRDTNSTCFIHSFSHSFLAPVDMTTHPLCVGFSVGCPDVPFEMGRDRCCLVSLVLCSVLGM